MQYRAVHKILHLRGSHTSCIYRYIIRRRYLKTRARGRKRNLAITAAASSFAEALPSLSKLRTCTHVRWKKTLAHAHPRSYTHAYIYVHMHIHTQTHTHMRVRKVRTSSSRPSTSSLLPQFTVSPSGGTEVFSGGRKGGGVGAKGKGDLRRDGDEEERKAEKGDERKERGKTRV